MVTMPQITAAIGERESKSKFVVRIENAANLLVGKYNIAEHKAYQELRHGRLNYIFELAGVLCHPRPKPIAWKHKSAAMGVAPTLRKTSRQWGRGRISSHFVTHTSTQELALAKSLKHSTKFAAKSSRHSPTEKASITRIEVAGKKMSSTFMARSGVARDPKCVLNLFDSGSPVSDDDTAPPEQPQKCSWEPSLSEDVPKSLVAQGIFE
jgi:hypothetical protein